MRGSQLWSSVSFHRPSPAYQVVTAHQTKDQRLYEEPQRTIKESTHRLFPQSSRRRASRTPTQSRFSRRFAHAAASQADHDGALQTIATAPQPGLMPPRDAAIRGAEARIRRSRPRAAHAAVRDSGS